MTKPRGSSNPNEWCSCFPHHGLRGAAPHLCLQKFSLPAQQGTKQKGSTNRYVPASRELHYLLSHRSLDPAPPHTGTHQMRSGTISERFRSQRVQLIRYRPPIACQVNSGTIGSGKQNRPLATIERMESAYGPVVWSHWTHKGA